jgi:uncharacterized Zn finger protein (UPF0148 family)
MFVQVCPECGAPMPRGEIVCSHCQGLVSTPHHDQEKK